MAMRNHAAGETRVYVSKKGKRSVTELPSHLKQKYRNPNGRQNIAHGKSYHRLGTPIKL